MPQSTDDVRISELSELSSAAEVMRHYLRTDKAESTVRRSRDAIHQILRGQDDRLLVVIGPCSIHDPEAALDHARRLLAERAKLVGDLEIVMRVYFENGHAEFCEHTAHHVHELSSLPHQQSASPMK